MALRLETLETREVPSGRGFFASAAGVGGLPRVEVFNSTTGAKVADFFAFETTFTGGATVAMGDVNNDGTPDLIVGAGPGGGPRVRVFNGTQVVSGSFNPNNTNAVIADFFAYEDTQRGGVTVATGNFVGGIFDEVVVGAGPGGGPRVRILDGQVISNRGRAFTSNATGDAVADFFAFESTFRNGVNVAANPTFVSLGSFSDLAVAPGNGGGPRVRLLSGFNINIQRTNFTSFGSTDVVADFFTTDPNTRAGVYVAHADVTGDGQPDLITGTGPGIAGTVTVYNGAQLYLQRTAFRGTNTGDRVDRFTPYTTNNLGSATVGTTVNASGSVSSLLYGTGGVGREARIALARYTANGGGFSRTTAFDLAFDATLITFANASN